MKKLLVPLIFVLLIVSCKKKEIPDPYSGIFSIQFTASTETFYLAADEDSTLGSGSPDSKWKIENNGNNQYTISPAIDDSLIINSLTLHLVPRPLKLTNDELFTLEPDTSDNTLIHIKSESNNLYLVFQYGLFPSGNFCCWGIGLGNLSHCTSDFSTAGATIDACQYGYKLIR